MNAHNEDDITARVKRGFDAGASAPELSPELVDGASTRTAPRLVNPQRNRAVAGGATLAVAAVAATALVVASPFQNAPLFTSAAGQGAASMSSDSIAGVSESRIAMWVNYEYIAGEGLSTDTGSGNVYQLKRTGNANDVLSDVARVFGLEGTPGETQYFDATYPSYVIGAEDGTAPSVTVSWTGTGNWWYNNPAAYPQQECVTPAVEPGADELIDPAVCEIVPTPASENLAPSEAEAATLAQAMFAETGLDVATSDVTVTRDEWQTSATANLVVDGTPTSIDWGVSWSPTGEISWAYGHSIEVVDRGSFGTVSATDAVDRLADWRWSGSAGPEYQGGMIAFAADSMLRSGEVLEGAAVEDPAAEEPSVEEPSVEPGDGTEPVQPADPADPVDPAEPSEPSEPTDEPTDGGTLEPAPLPDETVEPEPMPEPETVVVTVDTAKATLLMMWDADGNVWLVPGFAIQQPEGWWTGVVSLVEGVIALPELIEG